MVEVADEESNIANPLSVASSDLVRSVLEGFMQVLLIPVVVVAAASLVLRFWRSRGEERQQMKWLTYVAALMPVLILLANRFQAADYAAGAVFASVPVVVGVAVLKYRLYDIDRIINKTLVYGVLTASLVVAYFGGVTLLQGFFRALTGQEQQPQLVVVASTLMIAALFNPFRRGIQAFIDRRFYRRRYDAARTLEAFSATLRDETDLDRLGGELVEAVRDTMQPEHVGLWLRPVFEVGRGQGEERTR